MSNRTSVVFMVEAVDRLPRPRRPSPFHVLSDSSGPRRPFGRAPAGVLGDDEAVVEHLQRKATPYRRSSPSASSWPTAALDQATSSVPPLGGVPPPRSSTPQAGSSQVRRQMKARYYRKS